jgi:hypothetical protein
MRSSYLKLKAACPVRALNLKRSRQHEFGRGFPVNIFGSSTLGAEMNMVPAVNCVAGTPPLGSIDMTQVAAEPAPDPRG